MRSNCLQLQVNKYYTFLLLKAIVCVGGDGTFSEVFNGLILRSARENNVDIHDSEVVLPPPGLPIGVIPSGSTDTIAHSLHGTTDIETAAIHIIFGDKSGLDICSVHSSHDLLRLYASVLSYGYLGDVVQDSENFRWMGPQRYDYSGKYYTIYLNAFSILKNKTKQKKIN